MTVGDIKKQYVVKIGCLRTLKRKNMIPMIFFHKYCLINIIGANLINKKNKDSYSRLFQNLTFLSQLNNICLLSQRDKILFMWIRTRQQYPIISPRQFWHFLQGATLTGPQLILLCYIYQSNMFAEELEAQQNLCDFSQKTNYLVEWTEKPINKYLKQLHKNPIAEEQEEEAVHRPTNKRSSDLIREASERYNLRKYQSKLEIINQIQYPLQDRQPFRPEHQYPIIKTSTQREYIPSPIPKRKGSVNSGSCRVVDVQFLNKKLQHFKRKHTESQKNINSRWQHVQFKYTPKSLSVKRNFKPKKQPNQKIVVNTDQIEQIKKMINKNSRRYSVPHFNDYFALGQLNL